MTDQTWETFPGFPVNGICELRALTSLIRLLNLAN
ncbi:hypothetical protein NOCARDAX2BIS_430014 [Nocardioides sp. AX2bis]|nr:hypothetical protein NOCARDAX2BIS_430014 [Nocardioides sp. AX2bis]